MGRTGLPAFVSRAEDNISSGEHFLKMKRVWVIGLLFALLACGELRKYLIFHLSLSNASANISCKANVACFPQLIHNYSFHVLTFLSYIWLIFFIFFMYRIRFCVGLSTFLQATLSVNSFSRSFYKKDYLLKRLDLNIFL